VNLWINKIATLIKIDETNKYNSWFKKLEEENKKQVITYKETYKEIITL